jgi:nitronate monooxygenase
VIPSVVLAPLAGGPSTPELAAAVANAGGLGFVAAGYLGPEAFAEQLARARRLTDGPLGANVFVLAEARIDENALAAYARELEPEGELGEPRFDDDRLREKVTAAIAGGAGIISTTFAPPPEWLVEAAHGGEVEVWATVANLEDARTAVEAGADVLVAQGAQAGGHRASFDDTDERDIPLLDLVAQLGDLGRPIVAAGGIVDRTSADAARAAGAAAVQAGTAFLLCPEAGTHPVHRAALTRGGETAVTRAFTGRRARGIVNRFMRDHPDAPSAYPHINHLTAPLRAAARANGDHERVNLWAGTAFAEAREAPASDVVASLQP